MVRQKVASIASQAAETHINELVQAIQTGAPVGVSTVYFETFEKLKDACAITPDIFRQRVFDYAQANYKESDVNGVVGNIMKESSNPNMGHKVFCKLVKAVFTQ